jgi:hypothetical protein
LKFANPTGHRKVIGNKMSQAFPCVDDKIRQALKILKLETKRPKQRSKQRSAMFGRLAAAKMVPNPPQALRPKP